MSSQSINYHYGVGIYRIQFDVIHPSDTSRPIDMPPDTSNSNKFSVTRIRVTEVGAAGRKRNLNFEHSFDTLAQAKTRVAEYAKRVVREQMPPTKIARR